MNIVRTIPDPLRDLNSILDPFQRLFRYEKGTPYGSYIPVTIFTQVKYLLSPIREIKSQKLREFLTSQKLIRLK